MPKQMAEQQMQMQVVSWSIVAATTPKGDAAANADDGCILGHKNHERFSAPTFFFEIKNQICCSSQVELGGKGSSA